MTDSSASAVLGGAACPQDARGRFDRTPGRSGGALGPTHPTSCLRRPSTFNPGLLTSKAFTLLEILLVLALMGLLASVLVVGGQHLLAEDRPTPEDLFWDACRSAQELAALGDSEVGMQFDEKERKLVWTNGREGGEAAFDATGQKIDLQFMPVHKGNSLILLAGQAVELDEMPRVTFYPDGTCTAFRVQFRIGASARQIAIDPWTCAPVLEKEETNS